MREQAGYGVTRLQRDARQEVWLIGAHHPTRAALGRRPEALSEDGR